MTVAGNALAWFRTLPLNDDNSVAADCAKALAAELENFAMRVTNYSNDPALVREARALLGEDD